MTLTLKLTQELERRLSQEAERRGISTDQFALHVLEQSLPSDENRAELIGLLQSWIDDDQAGERQEADVDLTGSLDADRLSDRQLYPKELKGVTW